MEMGKIGDIKDTVVWACYM